MTEDKKPQFTEMGRPKGRNFVQISIAVTPEQFEFLSKQANASEFMRGLLAGHMQQQQYESAALKELRKLYADLKDDYARTKKEFDDFNALHKDEIQRRFGSEDVYSEARYLVGRLLVLDQIIKYFPKLGKQ